jgi:hypothetical protein
LFGILVLAGCAPEVNAQTYSEQARNDFPREERIVGALTLSRLTQSTIDFSKAKRRSVEGLNAILLRRQLLEGAIPTRYTRENAFDSNYRNSDTFGFALESYPITFPQQSAWTEEITPVAESETWVTAALAAAFIMWCAGRLHLRRMIDPRRAAGRFIREILAFAERRAGRAQLGEPVETVRPV